MRDFFAVEEDAIFYAGILLLGSRRAQFDVRFVRKPRQLRFVIERNFAPQRFQRESAVHGAAVEIEIAEYARDETRYAALAGAGGAVDGDGEFGHVGSGYCQLEAHDVVAAVYVNSFAGDAGAGIG